MGGWASEKESCGGGGGVVSAVQEVEVSGAAFSSGQEREAGDGREVGMSAGLTGIHRCFVHHNPGLVRISRCGEIWLWRFKGKGLLHKGSG